MRKKNTENANYSTQSEAEQKQLYVLDLDKIMEFVFERGNKNTNVEITESFQNSGDKLVLDSKSIKEIKDSNNNMQECNIRYDLVKYLISCFTEIPLDMSEESVSFGESAILNTLINEEFLKLEKIN